MRAVRVTGGPQSKMGSSRFVPRYAINMGSLRQWGLPPEVCGIVREFLAPRSLCIIADLRRRPPRAARGKARGFGGGTGCAS